MGHLGARLRSGWAVPRADEREMCPWAISINVLVIRCPTHGFS
jgi:hypothetical protein